MLITRIDFANVFIKKTYTKLSMLYLMQLLEEQIS